MPIDVASIVSGALKPISSIIDSLHTSKEEKAEMKLAMINAQGALQNELVGYQKDIIIAEATGESWLQRNWRPLMMVWFAILVGAHWFGLTPENLTPEVVDKLFSIVQLGVGGYIVGRSGEKMVKTWKNGGPKPS